MQATMIKQQIAAHAIRLKLSAMASVNACCLTCRLRISPARPAAVVKPGRLARHPCCQAE